MTGLDSTQAGNEKTLEATNNIICFHDKASKKTKQSHKELYFAHSAELDKWLLTITETEDIELRQHAVRKVYDIVQKLPDLPDASVLEVLLILPDDNQKDIPTYAAQRLLALLPQFARGTSPSQYNNIYRLYYLIDLYCDNDKNILRIARKQLLERLKNPQELTIFVKELENVKDNDAYFKFIKNTCNDRLSWDITNETNILLQNLIIDSQHATREDQEKSASFLIHPQNRKKNASYCSFFDSARPHEIIHFLKNLIEPIFDGKIESWKIRTEELISKIVPALVYERDNSSKALTLKRFTRAFDITHLVELSQSSQLPDIYKSRVTSYLNTLPGYNEKAFSPKEQVEFQLPCEIAKQYHDYIKMSFCRHLDYFDELPDNIIVNSDYNKCDYTEPFTSGTKEEIIDFINSRLPVIKTDSELHSIADLENQHIDCLVSLLVWKRDHYETPFNLRSFLDHCYMSDLIRALKINIGIPHDIVNKARSYLNALPGYDTDHYDANGYPIYHLAHADFTIPASVHFSITKRLISALDNMIDEESGLLL